MTKHVTLTYTEEMERQDALWKEEMEDTVVMERLFRTLLDEARANGYTGHAHIYPSSGEMVCELHESEDQQRVAEMTGQDVEMYGYCKPLLARLEELCSGVHPDIPSRFQHLSTDFKIVYTKEGSDLSIETIHPTDWASLLRDVKGLKEDPTITILYIKEERSLDFLG